MENDGFYKSDILEQLPQDIDASDWPPIRLRSLELRNFGKFNHILVDFNKNNSISCLIGPNGSGKTTILSAIQMLFSNYNGYDDIRYKTAMLKYIRNFKHLSPQEADIADLLIKGIFEIDRKSEYCVEITRQNRIKSFHPQFVAERMPHYCFFTRYDQELHTFQLKRERWDKFKKLFESVTGFEIEEDETPFDCQTSDTRINNLLKKYVMSFNIRKPHETINHKQCSAGERKIIKTFSTVLNKSCQPNIILIDNALMHIEIDRHIPVVNALKECFDKSQLIITCHSEPVKRYLVSKNILIDMRFLDLHPLLIKETWRLRFIDELEEIKNKLIYSNFQDPFCASVIDEINTLIKNIFEKKDLINEKDHIVKLFLDVSHKAQILISKDLSGLEEISPIRNIIET